MHPDVRDVGVNTMLGLGRDVAVGDGQVIIEVRSVKAKPSWNLQRLSKYEENQPREPERWYERMQETRYVQDFDFGTPVRLERDNKILYYSFDF